MPKQVRLLKQLKQKKNIFKLKNYFFKRFDFFYNKIKLLSLIAFTLNDVRLLLQQFSERLTKIYKHKYALKQFLEFCQKINIININNYGIKVLIYGKINAKTRSKKAVIFYSKKPTTHTICNSLEYNYITAYTYTGTFGIHIWFVKQKIEN
jgi:ribosomal protein S3